MKSIGFWHPGADDQGVPYPQVETAVDLAWDLGERARIVEYLKFGKKHEQWRGSSACRVCGITNGSKDLTDDTYVWPEGYAHYVEVHGVKPPQDFLDHVFKTGEE